MRKSAPKLRLGPLPPTGTVKMTFTCPIGLKANLERYAQAYTQYYNNEKPVAVVTLIPHMLEVFMARDLGFKRGEASIADPQQV
jgi:hypothetical protein